MSESVDRVETGLSFSVLLECAADNDVEGFKRLVCDESEIREVGLWYGHQRVSKKRVLEHRTPLMIAAKYGSLDVLKLILSLPEIDVNFSSSPDKTTALHCAVSSGSANAADAVKLLLLAGADPNITDVNGHLPIDVIVANPNFPHLKTAIEELLKSNGSISPPVSKKEYIVDSSLPDIKDKIFTTDEFRMFSFKIQPCSRAYSHDWTECPFVHPGENARRRDPRLFQYSCVPCPDHRKGACRLGDLCEYSHGIFECWLHPEQYRTRICKDGSNCSRRVCFFAHTTEELRPLYSSSPQGVSPLSYFRYSPPMSPLSYYMHSPVAWHRQSLLNSQTRMRNSLNARDFLSDERYLLQDYELQHMNLLNLPNLGGLLLSPVKTGVSSPKVFENPQTHVSFGTNEPESPYTIAGKEKLQKQFGNLSLKEPAFEDKHCGDEPDVSWVQSVLKEPSLPEEIVEGSGFQDESGDHAALRSWL